MEIGTVVDEDVVVNMAGVSSALGLQSGIFVNDYEKITVLKMKNPKTAGQKYPNYWDSEIIGLLHFFGTNKGQNKNQEKQNLNSRLNKHVNESIFPIHVFVELENRQFMYMGQYTRLPKYDEWQILDDKEVISFGLISNNIEESSKILPQFLRKSVKKFLDLEIDHSNSDSPL